MGLDKTPTDLFCSLIVTAGRDAISLAGLLYLLPSVAKQLIVILDVELSGQGVTEDQTRASGEATCRTGAGQPGRSPDRLGIAITLRSKTHPYRRVNGGSGHHTLVRLPGLS